MEQGIFKMTGEEYHEDPAPSPSLSSSIAKILLSQSPAHARLSHPRLSKGCVSEESARFDLGTAAHDFLLEGNTGSVIPIDVADWRTKAAKAARDEARASGSVPVLAKHYEQLTVMRDVAMKAISECVDLPGLSLDNGIAEQTVLWKEPNGIWCRARPDWLSSSYDFSLLIDYKTAISAEPSFFSRQISRMGYDFQSMFYRRGIWRVTGIMPISVILAQELEPPYACSWHSLTPAMDVIAEQQVEGAIETWGNCLAMGCWPSYSSRIHYAEPTAWQLAQAETYALIQEKGQ